MESGLKLELEGLLNCESSPGPSLLWNFISWYLCPVSNLSAGTLPPPPCLLVPCLLCTSGAPLMVVSHLTLSLEENLLSPS